MKKESHKPQKTKRVPVKKNDRPMVQTHEEKPSPRSGSENVGPKIGQVLIMGAIIVALIAGGIAGYHFAMTRYQMNSRQVTSDLPVASEVDDKLLSDKNTPECQPVAGTTFKSGKNCFSCDDLESYALYTQSEYDSCLACSRKIMTDSYGTQKCVPSCPEGKVYHQGQKKCLLPKCLENADCGPGAYCRLDSAANGNSCTDKPAYGVCEATEKLLVSIEGVSYAKSVEKMPNWWSADHFCTAIGGTMVSVKDFECGYDFVQNKTTGYCNMTDSILSGDIRSEKMRAFQTQLGASGWYWTKDMFNDCLSYFVSLFYGHVYDTYKYYYNPPYGLHALCRME